jgi:hypothetical protein
MSALTILIIRHAEKPDDPTAPWPGPSFTENGKVDPDDKSLVIRGWQRAGSWAALFGKHWRNWSATRRQVCEAAP